MTPDEFEFATGKPLAGFAKRCHEASLLLVKSGVYGVARVARGSCSGVPGQHSWVILSHDVFDPDALIVDPTLWSYMGWKPRVWEGRNLGGHLPHGHGSVWQYGAPTAGDGEVIRVAGFDRLSDEARSFLLLCGPLDTIGWARLAGGPLQGWPAREVVEAMLDDPRLAAFVPIDVQGMLTDRNPGGLYLPEKP